MFNASQAGLAPYNVTGQGNLPAYQNFWQNTQNQLENAYGNVQAAMPQPMTESQLEATPGYQFDRSQGLRAVQNSAAASGLGVSGAALQGAATYGTGLADNTYQTQFGIQQSLFNDANTQFNNALNKQTTTFGQLASPVSIGENAAAQSGNNATTTGQGIASSTIAAGNAAAAGITGQSNAIANGLNGTANAGLTYLGMQNALNSGSGFPSGIQSADSVTGVPGYSPSPDNYMG
jgi:hypothetical protein